SWGAGPEDPGSRARNQRDSLVKSPSDVTDAAGKASCSHASTAVICSADGSMSPLPPCLCPTVERRGETGRDLPRTDAAERDSQGQFAHFEDVDVRRLRWSSHRPALAFLGELQPLGLH